jgi:quercetin dioxygenase-like cupin family protein
MNFFRTDDLPATEMLPGVNRRTVFLPDLMLTFVDFEPGRVLPEHDHPHQQITWIVSGAMEFDLDGEKRILRPGDGVLVPPNVRHSAVVLQEPCRALDAWHPIREDYI